MKNNLLTTIALLTIGVIISLYINRYQKTYDVGQYIPDGATNIIHLDNGIVSFDSGGKKYAIRVDAEKGIVFILEMETEK